MKIAVGIDLCEINRVEELLQKESFTKRILGPNETEYYGEKGFRAESIAAAFAAKEAFSKAMGTGVRGFELGEVEVLHDELGKPFYQFSGRALELVSEAGYSFDLSLTHSPTTAAAVAVAWKED